jgi:hypothetical protein
MKIYAQTGDRLRHRTHKPFKINDLWNNEENAGKRTW